MSGRSASNQKNGKWVLEMIYDLEMFVHVNLTQFSRCPLVNGEVDIRPIRQ
jgi:hypothetical protein